MQPGGGCLGAAQVGIQRMLVVVHNVDQSEKAGSGVTMSEDGKLVVRNSESTVTDESAAEPATSGAMATPPVARSSAFEPSAAASVDESSVTGVAPDAAAEAAPEAGDASSSVSPGAPSGADPSLHELLVAEGDAAGDYLERLLDILDFDGDIDLDVEGERAVVSIIGAGDVEKLVGPRGEVLDALQELTRLAATTETGQRSRLMLDISGYRARRRVELGELGRSTAEAVVQSGESVRLAPMNPFERKVVHDAVAAVAGVRSVSEGEEPSRRIVVSLAT